MNKTTDELDAEIAQLQSKLNQYENIFMAYRSALARTLDTTCENPSKACFRCSKNTTCKGKFAHDALVGVLGRDVNLKEMF